MIVFLTGGTGYLGGVIARELREHGHTVRALVRDPARAAALGDLGVEPVAGSLEEPGRWRDALAGCEGLVHSAAKVGVRGSAEAFDRINVAAALELADAAERAGVVKQVFTGSLFALGPTPPGETGDESRLDLPPGPLTDANHYVRTKTAIAHELRQRQRAGSRLIQVFPTVITGPGALTDGNHTAKVMADVGTGKLPGLIGSGKQRWNLVSVDAVAAGHRLVLERGVPGEAYILGGENWTQRRLVETAAREFGVKPPLRALGRAVPMLGAAVYEVLAKLTGGRPDLTRGEVKLYDADWAFTSDHAARGLGYAPPAMDPVIADTVRWLREEVLA